MAIAACEDNPIGAGGRQANGERGPTTPVATDSAQNQRRTTPQTPEDASGPDNRGEAPQPAKKRKPAVGTANDQERSETGHKDSAATPSARAGGAKAARGERTPKKGTGRGDRKRAKSARARTAGAVDSGAANYQPPSVSRPGTFRSSGAFRVLTSPPGAVFP